MFFDILHRLEHLGQEIQAVLATEIRYVHWTVFREIQHLQRFRTSRDTAMKRKRIRNKISSSFYSFEFYIRARVEILRAFDKIPNKCNGFAFHDTFL